MFERLQQAVRRADEFILCKITMPIAHWVDWRFHKNQWDLAKWSVTAGVSLCCMGTVQICVEEHSWWIRAFLFVGMLPVAFIYSKWVAMFAQCSKLYELDPTQFPRPGAHFLILPHSLRLFSLVFAIISATGYARSSILVQIGGCWITFIAAAIYFASGIPPWRERKAKKERAPNSSALWSFPTA